MDTGKRTGERIGITLALLACVGFSAFLIGLQKKQETDRQQLTEQMRERQQAERTQDTGEITVRSRIVQRRSEDGPVFSLPGGFYV